MRVLFVCFPSPSHFFPLVPLAWALRSAGHEIRVATSPSGAQHVHMSGLPGVLAGQQVDIGQIWRGQAGAPDGAADADERRRHAASRGERAMAMFTAVADAMLEDLHEMARNWSPDLVVYEPRAYAGPVVAEAAGLPAVRHLWGTDYTYLRRDLEAPLVEAFFDRHGVPDSTYKSLTIDPCPPVLQIPQTPSYRQPMRFVPYNGPGTEPEWVRAPRKHLRVCVTWGTTFGKTAGHVHPARQTLDALTTLDAEIVVAVSPNQRHLIPDYGSRVRVVEAMPLNLLLPACDLIVHQGGAGTTTTALVCGVPQIVVPTIADEPLNAERVAAAGVGRNVPAIGLTADILRKEIVGLLAGAAAMRERIQIVNAEASALPTPAQVVDVLERMAVRGGGLPTAAELSRQ